MPPTRAPLSALWDHQGGQYWMLKGLNPPFAPFMPPRQQWPIPVELLIVVSASDC